VGPADDRLATGETRHVFSDVEGRLRRAPEVIVETLERYRSPEAV